MPKFNEKEELIGWRRYQFIEGGYLILSQRTPSGPAGRRQVEEEWDWHVQKVREFYGI
jgi:hypothetical protein